MVTDLQSTLDAIDTLAVHQCGQCDRPLPDGSVSAYWCDDVCQEAWNTARGEALVGYREPEDLEAHYSNQPGLNTVTLPSGITLRHYCPGLPLVGARERMEREQEAIQLAAMLCVTVDTGRDHSLIKILTGPEQVIQMVRMVSHHDPLATMTAEEIGAAVRHEVLCGASLDVALHRAPVAHFEARRAQ